MNLRGIVLMVCSMAGFAVEDMFIKWASADVPMGQILVMLSIPGATAFWLLARKQGVPVWSRDLAHPVAIARNVGEMVGTLGFVTAISLIPLTTATAIFQAAPLVVTLGVAALMGEQVGRRRWVVMGIGFVGVLVVLRPGLEAFEPDSLWAVLAVLGLSIRDIATRRMPSSIKTTQLAFSGLVAVGVLGLGMLTVTGGARWLLPRQLMLIVGASSFGIGAYWAITEAMRAGEVSVITPFRYSRLLFALVIGALAFHERPDLPTLLGAALIIGSGLDILTRDARGGEPAQVENAAQ